MTNLKPYAVDLDLQLTRDCTTLNGIIRSKVDLERRLRDKQATLDLLQTRALLADQNSASPYIDGKNADTRKLQRQLFLDQHLIATDDYYLEVAGEVDKLEDELIQLRAEEQIAYNVFSTTKRQVDLLAAVLRSGE